MQVENYLSLKTVKNRKSQDGGRKRAANRFRPIKPLLLVVPLSNTVISISVRPTSMTQTTPQLHKGFIKKKKNQIV